MDDEIEEECHTVAEVCFFMFIVYRVLGLRHDGKNVQVYRYAEMKVYTTRYYMYNYNFSNTGYTCTITLSSVCVYTTHHTHVCVHRYDWIHERIDQSIHIGSRGLI